MKIIEAGNQTRTDDPFITSEVLYRLSYSGMMSAFCGPCYYILFSDKFQLFFTLSDSHPDLLSTLPPEAFISPASDCFLHLTNAR